MGYMPIRCTKEMSETGHTSKSIKVVAKDVGRYICSNIERH
jgi:hypothetical protein